MDSFTHLALGAIIGEAYAGKSLGKKAMVIGAVSQSLPDIDFVMSLWLSPVDNLLAHRGITHSLLFCLLASMGLGVLSARWQVTSAISSRKWIMFFVLQISIHLFLDALNNYGTGWFEPFNHFRVAFDIIYVADPFYAIWLVIGCMALLVLKVQAPARKIWIRMSLILSSLYLVYAIYNKALIQEDVKTSLDQQGISYSRYLSTPTPLNNWLWFVIAEDDYGYNVGYRSVLDETDSILFTHFPRRDDLLSGIDAQDDFDKLKRFSNGYYTIDSLNNSIVFNDLRFGQTAGWSDARAPFAFHYDLLHPEKNSFVVQQGRFANWNGNTVRAFLRRIAGMRT